MGNQMTKGECNQRMGLLYRGYRSFDNMEKFKNPDTDNVIRTTIILTLKQENELLKKMCGVDTHRFYLEKDEGEDYGRIE